MCDEHREDSLVWNYFQRQPSGFFIEVGANDPVTLSQTYVLEENGWDGILVEPQPACCERLREVRKRAHVFQAACGAPEQKGKARLCVASAHGLSALAPYTADKEEVFTHTLEVDVVTLDDLLASLGDPKPDFLSIDVEGAELDVLRGFDLARHLPKLILVEDFVFDLRLHSYLRANDYTLVRRTGCDNWYVPNRTIYQISLWERFCLFRKMYLGTPFRKLKRLIKRLRQKHGASG